MSKALEVNHKEKRENTKVETIKIIRLLLDLYYRQQLKGAYDPVQRLETCRKITFMPALADQVIKYLTDYHDNVREQAQGLLMEIVQNFITYNPAISESQQQSLNMLRANAELGWGESMKEQVRNAADMEGELNKHLFNDPQLFLKNIIAIMIDETHGRDTLLQVIKEFNRKTPFMMLNDYRIAVATNSLRRIEILRELIFKY